MNTIINCSLAASFYLLFVKCSDEKHYTSIRAKKYYWDFEKQLSAMVNIEGLERNDSTKTVMVRKCDMIILEAAYNYLHVFVQTKASRRDAMLYLQTH